MAYELTKIEQPNIDEDIDMWAAEISFFPDEGDTTSIKHTDCIEVYASDEQLLLSRVHIVLSALNDYQ